MKSYKPRISGNMEVIKMFLIDNSYNQIITLKYEDTIIGYRVYNNDNEFTDIPVYEVDKSSKFRGYYTVQTVLCSDGVARTPHEKFGWENKFIKIARVKDGYTWYVWRRPKLVELAKKIYAKVGKVGGIIDHNYLEVNEDSGTIEFMIRTSSDYGEYSGMAKAEDFEHIIRNWCATNFNIAIELSGFHLYCISCSYAEKGWFGVTIYLDDPNIA